MVTLPYGRVPYPLDLGGRRATIVEPRRPPHPPPLASLLVAALDEPIGRPRLETMIPPTGRVTVIVSDATRNEPRHAFLEALHARLPQARWTAAIATGTHGPSGLGPGLPDWLDSIVDHDGQSDRDLIALGQTSRGTPVRLHRCVVDTDLVIATGCIRPHYFAGFGAGVKAIFPGLGAARDVRINHALKQDARSRSGIVDRNPCRADLEEAVALLPTPTFLLDGVCASDDSIQSVVAGDPVAAFRVGTELARPYFTVQAPRSALVIASDCSPVTDTLYQAAKIAAAVAPIVEHTLVIVAECGGGTGPLDVVNEAIFRIGVLPRLPANVELHLVSSLSPDTVRRTLLAPLVSCESLLRDHDNFVVVPRASQLIFE